MTAKELAERLDGREYMEEITKEEELLARESGLVVVFGYSDDNTEFRGAIDKEMPAWDGGTFYVGKDGTVREEEFADSMRLEAVWCAPDTEAAWSFRTDIPHEKFSIKEDDEVFCEGIVFALSDI